MGGDCSNPPPGWPARSQKTLRLTSSHRSQQAPHQGVQDLRDQGSPSQAGKSTPLGIIHSIVAVATSSSDHKAHRITDLIQLGFYFCLRSCEYNKRTGHHRTFQFRPSWNSCSSLGTFSYLWTPQSSIYTKRLRLSSPWITRKTPSEVRPSLTSDWSPL